MAKFKCQNCGECCGPIPVMNWELKKIQKELLKLPEEERERLRGQECAFLTCPLRDKDIRSCKGEYCVGILGITLSFEDIENWEEGVETCQAEHMKII